MLFFPHCDDDVAAADCGIEAAVELFPCAEVNGTEPTKACCDGLFTAIPQKNQVNIQRWAEAGCFCNSSITDYDKPFFAKVIDLAKKCTGKNANLKAPVKLGEGGGSCPTNIPANGFLGYKDGAAVKAAVEALPPKVPPAPPPAPKAKPLAKTEVAIKLSVNPDVIGTAAEKKELADALAAKLGLKPGQVKISLVSKGSTIITAEITPAPGQNEISGAEMDKINAEIAQAQKNTTTGAFLPAKYGSVKATLPAPGPAGAPAPIRPSGKVVLKTPSPPSALPPTIIGLPRSNPLDGGKEYKGGFAITNNS